jgi:hypothetical protein
MKNNLLPDETEWSKDSQISFKITIRRIIIILTCMDILQMEQGCWNYFQIEFVAAIPFKRKLD